MRETKSSQYEKYKGDRTSKNWETNFLRYIPVEMEGSKKIKTIKRKSTGKKNKTIKKIKTIKRKSTKKKKKKKKKKSTGNTWEKELNFTFY